MRERQTARIILLDQSHRILLFQISDQSPGSPIRWIGPGGGIEPGETALAAAHRELFEETGLRNISMSDQIATFEYDIPFDGEPLHVVHHVFVAAVDEDVIDHSGLTDEERTMVTGFRWWSIEELRDEQPEVRPPGFVELMERVVRGNIRQSSPPRMRRIEIRALSTWTPFQGCWLVMGSGVDLGTKDVHRVRRSGESHVSRGCRVGLKRTPRSLAMNARQT
jgi:8-oxo-dGTP pyrophosphatase MutT (NUDIX family)